MNPPSVGHQKLVDKINSVAKKEKAVPELYLSHSQDKKKNPLSYLAKINIAKKSFGKIVKVSKARTIIEVLKSIQDKYDDVIIVVGSDRVSDFDKLVSTYNGKDYTFNSIKVISAGERDPDAEGVEGMSASKLRGFVKDGNYESFKSGMPGKLKDRDIKFMYDEIRKEMGINEEIELDEAVGSFTKEYYKPLKPSQKSAIERALKPLTIMYMKDGYNVIVRTQKDADLGTAVLLFVKKDKGFSSLVAHKSMGPNGKLKDIGINEEIELDEALNLQQRLKRRQLMRRIKSKIKLGRKRAKYKLANKDKLEKRSSKRAREIMRKKLAGSRGENYKDLPLSARQEIDKKIEKKKTIIARLAKRLLPKVRKAEQERLKMARQSRNESYNFLLNDEHISLTESEYLDLVSMIVDNIDISESIEKNLMKKSDKYNITFDSLKENFLRYKELGLTEQEVFDKINHDLLEQEQQNFTKEKIKREKQADKLKHDRMMDQARLRDVKNKNKEPIKEALQYHLNNNIPLSENIFRLDSNNYYALFNEAREQYNNGLLENLDQFDIELLESDIGLFDSYNGIEVPLDCPMLDEEDEKKTLNKPMRGGPKKFQVYVKDPQTGNIKKVTFGDTTGLKAKINDPDARKSFAARHQCSTKKDKTSPGYWSCRLPYYAKQLGLSGGGNFFW